MHTQTTSGVYCNRSGFNLLPQLTLKLNNRDTTPLYDTHDTPPLYDTHDTTPLHDTRESLISQSTWAPMMT